MSSSLPTLKQNEKVGKKNLFQRVPLLKHLHFFLSLFGFLEVFDTGTHTPTDQRDTNNFGIITFFEYFVTKLFLLYYFFFVRFCSFLFFFKKKVSQIKAF